MLRRKTIWRKTKIVQSDNNNIDGNEMTLHTEAQMDIDNDSFALLNKTNPTPIKKLRSALSISNFLNMTDKVEKPKDTRTLRFSSTVRVCLIPCRQDMLMLSADIFWESDDYTVFKNEAVAELKETLHRLGITAKLAIAKLYQPSIEERMNDYTIVYGAEEAFNRIHNSSFTDNNNIIETTTLNSEQFPRVSNSSVDLTFITGIKTDVEMNKMEMENFSKDSNNLSLPVKTPSGLSNTNQNMWAVKWNPGTNNNNNNSVKVV